MENFKRPFIFIFLVILCFLVSVPHRHRCPLFVLILAVNLRKVEAHRGNLSKLAAQHGWCGYETQP